MESKITYFDNPGSENTGEVFRIARQRAEELGIKTIIGASTTGVTAAKAVEAFSGFTVIAVGHSAGIIEPDTQEFTEQNRKIVESKGGRVLITTLAFAGISRAMRQNFGMFVIGDIIANTLRIFGYGMKVVCEITMMAADSGLVPTDRDVVVIAGSTSGADTAVVLKPVNSQDFFALHIKEILCKPHYQKITARIDPKERQEQNLGLRKELES